MIRTTHVCIIVYHWQILLRLTDKLTYRLTMHIHSPFLDNSAERIRVYTRDARNTIPAVHIRTRSRTCYVQCGMRTYPSTSWYNGSVSNSWR